LAIFIQAWGNAAVLFKRASEEPLCPMADNTAKNVLVDASSAAWNRSFFFEGSIPPLDPKAADAASVHIRIMGSHVSIAVFVHWVYRS